MSAHAAAVCSAGQRSAVLCETHLQPTHCWQSCLQAKKVRPGDVLTDSRFAAMFENRDFEVDLDADEYKQLHPNAGA